MKKVSIGVPTYNRSKYLYDTLESILKQSYQNIEVIVSDNASEDETKEMIERLLKEKKYSFVRYYRQAMNIGQVANWNFCIRKATGTYFLMLSDDDLLESNAIFEFVNEMRDGISLVIGNFSYINEYGEIIKKHGGIGLRESGEEFINRLLKKEFVCMPSAIMHRLSDAKYVGGYPDIGTTTDRAFQFLLAELGNVVYINKVLVLYRLHSSSLSFDINKVALSHINFMKWGQQKYFNDKSYISENINFYCKNLFFLNFIKNIYKGELYNSYIWIKYLLISCNGSQNSLLKVILICSKKILYRKFMKIKNNL